MKVIIVGAGPAGTAAAYDLLQAGARVLLLDKKQFPRKKACAGGLTPKALALYRYDISSVIQRSCATMHIRPKKPNIIKIQSNQPLCHMTCREDLDELSLKKVMAKGARFRVVKQISAIVQDKSGVTVETDRGRFSADYLIGADGANSRVRRFVFPFRAVERQTAFEADVAVDRPEMYKMEFDFSMIANGYFWLFPKKNHVNIGIYQAGASQKVSRQMLCDYAKKRLGSNRLAAVKGYPICTHGTRHNLGSGRILLAGDAAGMAEPLLGEGIYFALKSGQIAAICILESSRLGNKPPAVLYKRKLKAVLADLQIYNFASKCFYSFPGFSLALLANRKIHGCFASGYSQGKTLCRILGLKFLTKF